MNQKQVINELSMLYYPGGYYYRGYDPINFSFVFSQLFKPFITDYAKKARERFTSDDYDKFISLEVIHNIMLMDKFDVDIYRERLNQYRRRR